MIAATFGDAKGAVRDGPVHRTSDNKGIDMELKLNWNYVADTVMGGVSRGQIAVGVIDGRVAARLTGDVSLDNDGGFIQMASDIGSGGRAFDASAYAGIAIDLIGNGETYDLRLRTTDLTRPWQSYRVPVTAGPDWTTHRIAFADFEGHRTVAPFAAAHLRRIGIVAIGRVFHADVAVAGVTLYRA